MDAENVKAYQRRETIATLTTECGNSKISECYITYKTTNLYRIFEFSKYRRKNQEKKIEFSRRKFCRRPFEAPNTFFTE